MCAKCCAHGEQRPRNSSWERRIPEHCRSRRYGACTTLDDIALNRTSQVVALGTFRKDGTASGFSCIEPYSLIYFPVSGLITSCSQWAKATFFSGLISVDRTQRPIRHYWWAPCRWEKTYFMAVVR